MKNLKLAYVGMGLLALFFRGFGQSVEVENESYPHWQQWEEYQRMGLESEQEWDQYQQTAPATMHKTTACTLNKKVYGWHPYWVGTAYTSYDFNLLSTFSYFSYEVDPATGNYTSIHSWKTTPSVTLAQAAGCRVELSVTLFGGTNNATFLPNLTARQRLIDSLITLVQYRNADGVNIDFEGIPGSQRANFTSFMQSLSTQLKTAIPGASLTMALYSVDWNNVFDIPALDPYVDEFIIMGYGYYYSGSSTAGPNAPLWSGTNWAAYNLTKSVLYYVGQGITRSKLLVGLPYYGNEYTTTTGSVPSASTGFVSSRTYAYTQNNYAGVRPEVWDDHSATLAWVFQTAGVWHQAWGEDNRGMAEKFDLPIHLNIGGIGIWALGYDNGYTELWDLIEQKFSDCGTPVCADTLYDTGGPLGQYANNENYSFTITSPAGEMVKASFPTFNLEANYDYLYVYDGPTTASPLIGQYSGTTAPSPITSTGDALTFRFTSDGATRAAGYAIDWVCEGLPTYPDTIRLDHTDSAFLNCGIPYHVFLDSDLGTAGTYTNGENNKMTFCNPDTGGAVKLNFLMQTPPVQLDLRSTTTGNDYLWFHNGPDTTAPMLGVYTGSTNSYPQPGTVVSTGRCMTVHFESDGNTTGNGWVARLRCSSEPANLGTTLVDQANHGRFTDSGDTTANYANNESYVRTYCPTPTALAAGKAVWADFSTMGIEQNYDYLHVFDGPDRYARLLCSYTGNSVDVNDPFILKATEENPSGCLTFEFNSDGGATRSGWSADILVGKPRRPYGTEHCTNATLISVVNEPYAGSTTLATGAPNAEDPPLNVSLGTLPECSGANAITRLENSIWYKFTTPSTLCPSSNINILLENISCQNSIPGGNGAQFMLYQSPTCQVGSGWGSPIYCADKLLDGVPVNIAGLLAPSSTYYIVVDGFAGQHCNLDLILTGDINGCILPIELIAFEGRRIEIGAQLDWETANELQNAGFFVERAWQGGNGDLEWQTLGWVDAHPVDKSGQYQWLDTDFRADRMNFYRLKQMDINGATHLHKIISLSDPSFLPTWNITCWPNPAQNQLHFSFGTALEKEGVLEILDVSGRKIAEQSLIAGTTQFAADLTALPDGIFLWRIRSGEHMESQNWVKQSWR